MNVIYTKKHFNIYKMDRGFIVHNTNKDFEDGHSHINNQKTAKWIIDLAIHKSIPRHINRYLLVSLIRVSSDEGYIRKIEELIASKDSKSVNNYYNKSKVIR